MNATNHVTEKDFTKFAIFNEMIQKYNDNGGAISRLESVYGDSFLKYKGFAESVLEEFPNFPKGTELENKPLELTDEEIFIEYCKDHATDEVGEDKIKGVAKENDLNEFYPPLIEWEKRYSEGKLFAFKQVFAFYSQERKNQQQKSGIYPIVEMRTAIELNAGIMEQMDEEVEIMCTQAGNFEGNDLIPVLDCLNAARESTFKTKLVMEKCSEELRDFIKNKDKTTDDSETQALDIRI